METEKDVVFRDLLRFIVGLGFALVIAVSLLLHFVSKKERFSITDKNGVVLTFPVCDDSQEGKYIQLVIDDEVHHYLCVSGSDNQGWVILDGVDK